MKSSHASGISQDRRVTAAADILVVHAQNLALLLVISIVSISVPLVKTDVITLLEPAQLVSPAKMRPSRRGCELFTIVAIGRSMHPLRCTRLALGQLRQSSDQQNSLFCYTAHCFLLKKKVTPPKARFLVGLHHRCSCAGACSV